MDDRLRATPRAETKYGAMLDADDYDPVDCRLCDHTAASPEAHNEHMQTEHDL